ncbi:MAG: hypothetical protein VX949_08565 [Planctomycetota bacterium]|nr:hypothetical protein [Planctomycetota bacterium]
MEEDYSFQHVDRLRSLISQRKGHQIAPARGEVTVAKVTEADIPIHDERRSVCQQFPGAGG